MLAIASPAAAANHWAIPLSLHGDENLAQSALHAVGLRGQGQVLAISDDGLDVDSCYFRDDSRPDVPRSHWDAPAFDATHRKVAQYVDFADGLPFRQGHGTHVSGVAAGAAACGASAQCTNASRFNGVAPAARIAFFDVRAEAAPPVAGGASGLLGSMLNTVARYSSPGFGHGFAVPQDTFGVLLPPGFAAGFCDGALDPAAGAMDACTFMISLSLALARAHTSARWTLTHSPTSGSTGAAASRPP